jgi:hypothetical protein
MVYVVQISRFVLIMIFLYSFLTKLRTFSAFVRTINHFGLLPRRFHRIAAIGVLAIEFGIVILSLLGGVWLLPAYIITIAILSIFIYALSSVLRRELKTSCNCFGVSSTEVSLYDIWRNTGIIAVTVFGVMGIMSSPRIPQFLELLLSFVSALIISILLINFVELIKVFKNEG